jgi:polyisoprenoid-binding protein YceI
MASTSDHPFNPHDVVGTWELDSVRTSIEFHTKALWMLPAKGTFRAPDGRGAVSAHVGVRGPRVIDASAVEDNSKWRDAHPRTAAFFEVDTHPTITYEATNGRIAGSGTLAPEVTLTVHGAARPLAVAGGSS